MMWLVNEALIVVFACRTFKKFSALKEDSLYKSTRAIALPLASAKCLSFVLRYLCNGQGTVR